MFADDESSLIAGNSQSRLPNGPKRDLALDMDGLLDRAADKSKGARTQSSKASRSQVSRIVCSEASVQGDSEMQPDPLQQPN